jgi:hypothetical protein
VDKFRSRLSISSSIVSPLKDKDVLLFDAIRSSNRNDKPLLTISKSSADVLSDCLWRLFAPIEGRASEVLL